jgi:hypothetical protein
MCPVKLRKKTGIAKILNLTETDDMSGGEYCEINETGKEVISRKLAQQMPCITCFQMFIYYLSNVQ